MAVPTVIIRGVACALTYPVRNSDARSAIKCLEESAEIFTFYPFKGKLVTRSDDMALSLEQGRAHYELLNWLITNAGYPDDRNRDERWLINLDAIARQLEDDWLTRWRARLYPDLLPPHLKGSNIERLALITMLASAVESVRTFDDALALLRREAARETIEWRAAVSVGHHLMPARYT